MIFGKKKSINSGVEVYKGTEGALLIDVREVNEYSSGHIPEAVNVPLSTLNSRIAKVVPDHDKTLFVYCLSGARSRKAADILKTMGYGKIKNIGASMPTRGL